VASRIVGGVDSEPWNLEAAGAFVDTSFITHLFSGQSRRLHTTASTSIQHRHRHCLPISSFFWLVLGVVRHSNAGGSSLGPHQLGYGCCSVSVQAVSCSDADFDYDFSRFFSTSKSLDTINPSSRPRSHWQPNMTLWAASVVMVGKKRQNSAPRANAGVW